MVATLAHATDSARRRTDTIRAMYLYVLGPIDYFAAFLPAEEYYRRVEQELGDESVDYVARARGYVTECVRLLEASTYYQSSDHAVGPFVSALPDARGSAEPSVLVSVKGHNNGTFYLASPIELPWLSEHLTA